MTMNIGHSVFCFKGLTSNRCIHVYMWIKEEMMIFTKRPWIRFSEVGLPMGCLSSRTNICKCCIKLSWPTISCWYHGISVLPQTCAHFKRIWWWPICHYKNSDEIAMQMYVFRCVVYDQSHVLAHFLKSIRAYNVKSSSTLFLDNIQWNFEISFPCARFNSLLGYNLITKSWDHQKWDFQTPISWNWKNTLSCEIYFFEKL